MSRVAFMTIGILREPGDTPAMQPFFSRIVANFEAAAHSAGNVAVASDDNSAWGPQVLPRFSLRPEFQNRRVVTLSLWEDVESVFAYAYNGVHGDALSHRKEWFVHPEWPGYVAWWIADDEIPTWQEAADRFDLLHDKGPTPNAFNFGKPFDADGQPAHVDRALAKEKAEKNTRERHGNQ